MLPRKKSLSSQLKAQILLESDEIDCTISHLALKHRISASRIYHWRYIRNKLSASKVSNEFVELIPEVLSSLPSMEYIQTNLKFANFTFSIEGKLSHKKYSCISSIDMRQN